MSFTITTTGIESQILLDDLAYVTIVHPTVDLDLQLTYDITDIGASLALAKAISYNWIIAYYNGILVDRANASALLGMTLMSNPLTPTIPGTNPSNANIAQDFIAGEALDAQRVVKIQAGKVYYFDTTNENDIGYQLGMTNNAAATNQYVTVVFDGVMTNPGWGLTPDGVYFATGLGQLTVSIPTSGIDQRIGVAIDANTLKLEFSEPCILA